MESGFGLEDNVFCFRCVEFGVFRGIYNFEGSWKIFICSLEK